VLLEALEVGLRDYAGSGGRSHVADEAGEGAGGRGVWWSGQGGGVFVYMYALSRQQIGRLPRGRGEGRINLAHRV